MVAPEGFVELLVPVDSTGFLVLRGTFRLKEHVFKQTGHLVYRALLCPITKTGFASAGLVSVGNKITQVAAVVAQVVVVAAFKIKIYLGRSQFALGGRSVKIKHAQSL